jgi:hypothetical protein
VFGATLGSHPAAAFRNDTSSLSEEVKLAPFLNSYSIFARLGDPTPERRGKKMSMGELTRDNNGVRARYLYLEIALDGV